MPTVVQVNFDYDVTEEELARRSNPERAAMFRTVRGLRWKIWMRDAGRRESGGIYLFDDRESAEAYVNGPIVAAARSLPNASGHSVKMFEVREEVSAVTGAPIDVRMSGG